MSELLIVAIVLCQDSPPTAGPYHTLQSTKQACFANFTQCLKKNGYPHSDNPKQLDCFKPKE